MAGIDGVEVQLLDLPPELGGSETQGHGNWEMVKGRAVAGGLDEGLGMVMDDVVQCEDLMREMGSVGEGEWHEDLLMGRDDMCVDEWHVDWEMEVGGVCGVFLSLRHVWCAYGGMHVPVKDSGWLG